MVIRLSQVTKRERVHTLKQDLEDFIKRLKEVEEYPALIEDIIELHLRFDNTKVLLKNIEKSINDVVKVRGSVLFNYFQLPRFFSIEELNLNASEYSMCLKFINNLKKKYGGFFSRILEIDRNPFFINSIETSVGRLDSIHSIKFTRVDGEALNALFKPNILMSMITNLINVLQSSMERGIFDINEQVVKDYMIQSKKMENYLSNLTKDRAEREMGEN